jgi:putative DNA primase/helicase
VGSWLPGVVVEHLLPILYGSGANGKSVFIETICGMLGADYAMKAPPGFLIASKHDRHPTELADLHGKRLVAAIETADGGRLSEVLAKELSGGDTIRARRMREDFWQFTPSHSLVLASNYKPSVRGVDHGIWRRLRLIPFVVTITEANQDKHLAAKLRDEWPAILRWACSGCIKWQRNGLATPVEVLAATESYKVESDTFKQWLDECCEIDPSAEWKASLAYHSFCEWFGTPNERPMSSVKFSEQVSIHQFTKSPRRRDGYYYLGFKKLGPGV